MQYEILRGDCIEQMRALPDASFDSIVTDPPYELGFMGKSWDASGIAYCVAMWAEALRVLKPGGHLLAFSGSRTYHRMTCAIEDAGFEVRDQIMWVYGSGFPKSLDVSKAIDKARTEDKEPTRVICRAVRAAMGVAKMTSRDLAPAFGGCHPRLVDHWAARDTDSQPSLPTWSQWQTLRSLLPLPAELDSEVWRLNERKGQVGDTYRGAEIVGHHEGVVPGLTGMRFEVADTSIRALSDAARQWEGWGTALKPAHEPICVARKPLAKGATVAANVLAHGTGAINIDACRVATSESDPNHRPGETEITTASDSMFGNASRRRGSLGEGRWPANLIHDGSDEVVALFPDVKSGARAAGSPSIGDHGTFSSAAIPASSGSAARFFYCAKASKSDRGPNNTHPTVKPLALMQYLCRLVTPPSGRILDPFAGSGSTIVAALREGFTATGIELLDDHADIIEGRLDEELYGDII